MITKFRRNKKHSPLNIHSKYQKLKKVIKKYSHSAPVSSVVISPCGNFVASASLDGQVKLYNFMKSNSDDSRNEYTIALSERELFKHTNPINQIAINSQFIISGSYDGKAII